MPGLYDCSVITLPLHPGSAVLVSRRHGFGWQLVDELLQQRQTCKAAASDGS